MLSFDGSSVQAASHSTISPSLLKDVADDWATALIKVMETHPRSLDRWTEIPRWVAAARAFDVSDW
jgi:hypothetical protein